jgi:N-acetyl-gamma-glutamyl-phosphate reductase
MKKISVGILGATAYTGVELVKILTRHPQVSIGFLSSQSYAGQTFSSVFGEMKGICDFLLLHPEETVGKDVECVFSCLPHAVSAELCIPFIQKGIKVIDLSADFRIRDPKVYAKWYDHEHPGPALLERAVFGLPERYRDELWNAALCANPGCYPTSILLPLIPLLLNSAPGIKSIIADSKSGVSGAGRSLKLTSLFAEANENFSAYSIGHKHRHVSEIDQELSRAAGRDIEITFSPHLVPMNRGILSTIYILTDASAEECAAVCRQRYKDEPFIRVRECGDLPKVRYVVNTNFCDIAFTGGGKGRPVIAVSVIDNMIKGASGQAVQNLNIMCGFEETAGLR